ncbi:MAG: hypothetical protein WAZ14_03760 [Patescibacteria group bacterium]
MPDRDQDNPDEDIDFDDIEPQADDLTALVDDPDPDLDEFGEPRHSDLTPLV